MLTDTQNGIAKLASLDENSLSCNLFENVYTQSFISIAVFQLQLQ